MSKFSRVPRFSNRAPSPTECFAALRSSMRVVVCEYDQDRPYHDGEIQPNTPVVNVPNIEFDPAFHLIERIRLAAGAVNLSPTRNTGLHVVTERVFLDG